jgi:subtilisin family serine protease
MAKKIIVDASGAKIKDSGATGRLLVKLDDLVDLDAVRKIGVNVFERLRIGLVEVSSVPAVKKMVGAKGSPFVAAEPERVIRKIDDAGGPRSAGSGRGGARPGGGLADSKAATWGIRAVNVLKSELTGKGVKMAVLDTGFDFTHPDFEGRTIHRKSFVGRQAIDKDGHGTHCVGIAGGGRKGKAGFRYGVAPGSKLYIGKILDDNGEGSDGLALAGIEWALEKGCRVISMSFGAEPEEGHSPIFESVAQTVLANRCLLVAATGNDSKRGRMAPVNHPANCPSVLAVGALTAGMKVAEFSCGGSAWRGEGVGGSGARGGGQVDLAAPGDEILSAKVGGGYVLDSGTSMAAPFVAGMAALLWERYPDAGAWEIWTRLMQQARRLGLSAAAVGAGLVYAG